MSLKTNCEHGHASSDGDAKLGVRFAVAPEEHAQEKQVREHLGAAGFHNKLHLGKAALDKCT